MSGSLREFVKENNVIGFAVAMISALAIKDLINAFIGNLLVPGLNTFLIGLQIKSFSKFLPGGEKIDGLPVIKALLSFIFTFMLLYFSITTMLSYWDKK